MSTTMKPKFSLGRIVATPGALEALRDAGQDASFFLDQHVIGNWGTVGRGDWKRNDEALQIEERLLSAYVTLRGVKIWIISEADRSSTCILLPEEY
jgi:hypothetical protein